MHMKRRCRSSSRCSTSVASSPWPRRRGGASKRIGSSLVDGFVLARQRGGHGGSSSARPGSCVVCVGSGFVVPADRVLELAHPLAERAADLRQALRAEEQERQQQEADDLERTDVRHAATVPGLRRVRTENQALDLGNPAHSATMRPHGARPRSPFSKPWRTTMRHGNARAEEPARRAGGRHGDRQGSRPHGRIGRDARGHGPERLGQVHARLRDRGPSRPTRSPRARSCSTARTSPSPAPTSAPRPGSSSPSSTRTRSRASPSRTSCGRRSTRCARPRNGGVDDPIPIPEFRKELLRADGPAQGQPRARLALPERRLLGRREEAGRDPADGDAEAEDRGARRDRLRARHRRAEDRRGAASRTSSAPTWARS